MEIKTKFNMGDDIYFITNRGIRHGNVVGFDISKKTERFTNFGSSLHFNLQTTYDVRYCGEEYCDLYEEYCFSTKKELIGYLISSK